jgi:hypothetical protein
VRFRLFSFLFLVFISNVSASNCSDSTVRIVTWNLLNFPSQGNLGTDTSTRNPYYRIVMQAINADIIVTQENTGDVSVPIFLNSVLNANGNLYSAGTFINGYDSDNGIFYRTSCFSFLSNVPIHTALRDVSEFTLVHNATNDTIRIFSCHLKASADSTNEELRRAETDSIRKFTNALPFGTDFIICGDFNFYSSYEPAYQNLLHDDSISDGKFVDPLSMPGIWNNVNYRFYHTQSPRVRSFGGGSTGGMDDRFDLILLSSAVDEPGRISYKPNSLTPFGNDGMHYQDSINQPPNAAVSQTVANALHYASDHLPLYAEFIFAAPIGINEIEAQVKSLKVFPNPTQGDIWVNIDFAKETALDFSIYDAMSRRIKNFRKDFSMMNHKIKIANSGDLPPGNYLLKVTSKDGSFLSCMFCVE